jgi:hypothetical protein
MIMKMAVFWDKEYVVWHILINVLEEFTASIISITIPNYIVLHPRRHPSLSYLLLQIYPIQGLSRISE